MTAAPLPGVEAPVAVAAAETHETSRNWWDVFALDSQSIPAGLQTRHYSSTWPSRLFEMPASDDRNFTWGGTMI